MGFLAVEAGAHPPLPFLLCGSVHLLHVNLRPLHLLLGKHFQSSSGPSEEMSLVWSEISACIPDMDLSSLYGRHYTDPFHVIESRISHQPFEYILIFVLSDH